jgi:hypothetical protein
MKAIKHPKDETKPEGFNTEFKLNVKYIFWTGLFIIVVTGAVIKYFG